MTYERGRDIITSLASQESDSAGDMNEATTRLRLIDRIFFEALGWAPEECVVEEHHEGSYVDYAFGQPARKLVVEAKKEGTYFELPIGFDSHKIDLNEIRSGHPKVGDAIGQALEYCQSRGIGAGAVSNGHQIIAFIGSRQDGVPPFNGKGLVFPSLDSMAVRFRELWDALSKPGIEARHLYTQLAGGPIQPPPDKLSARIVDYPGHRNRNPIAVELQILGGLFIDDIIRHAEVEEHFLRAAYCPSGALSQYALVSREILRTRYSAVLQERMGVSTTPIRTKKGIADDLRQDIIAASLGRRPIVLVGDIGAGKSIFIRNLIAVEAKDELANAIVLYVDFGSQPALATDIQTHVTEEFVRELRENYEVDVDERNFVRGVYNSDLRRFEHGIYSDLKESDPTHFRSKEIDFLAEKITNRDEHLRACFEHIVRARRQHIVVFLDNVDQRPSPFQEQVFLIAAALAETWPVSAFVSLRPDTFVASRNGGTLAAYQPRVFTIEPPRVDLVIQRRLEYALGELRAEGGLLLDTSAVTVKSTTLDNYLQMLLEAFESSGEVVEFVDNMSGGNVRRALDFLVMFIGSGHVDSQKILDIIDRSGSYTLPLHEFMRAVLFGDGVYYDPASSFIPNIFDVSSPDPREHFLISITAAFVQAAGETSGNEGYVPASRVFDYCQGLGFDPHQVAWALERCLRYHIIRGPEEPGSEIPSRVRITSIGGYTVKRLAHSFTYVDGMIVDTPILDAEYRGAVLDVFSIADRLDRVETFADYLDEKWRGLAGIADVFSWPSHSVALRQELTKVRLRIGQPSLADG